MGLFPPRSTPTAKAKKGAAFRPTDAQRAYLEQMKARGHSHTKVLSTALDILIEADREMDKEFRLLEVLAELHGLTLPQACARAMKLGTALLNEQLSKAKANE